jgi:hypothetical protein
MNALFIGLYSAILPTLLQLFALFLMAWLVRVSTIAKARWGIEIEARHREALHSAIMSGLQAALGRGLSGPDAIAAAITHTRASVPDALAALKPAADVLASIAEAKLKEAFNKTPMFHVDLGAPLPAPKTGASR